MTMKTMKMNNKKSFRENANKTITIKDFIKSLDKEDIDFIKHLVSALQQYLNQDKINNKSIMNKLWLQYTDPEGKVPELVNLVAEEFNNSYIPIYFNYGGKSAVSFLPNENFSFPSIHSKSRLSDKQCEYIYNIAKLDYETGHPFSSEDAVEWFKSDEEEEIPAELAEEAADYYFEVFDQIREEDNNQDLNEDFEFYKTDNGKIGVDKVINTTSKSGKTFKDGSDNKGNTSSAVKRIPLDKMSDEDKKFAKAVYKTLTKDGTIKHLDKKFKISPKPDVVVKADGTHADIYYDDNTTGEPDEKDVRLVASRKRPKEKFIKEDIDRSFNKIAANIGEAFDLAEEMCLPEFNPVYKTLDEIYNDWLINGWFGEYDNPEISPRIASKIKLLKERLLDKESKGYLHYGDLYDQIYDLLF